MSTREEHVTLKLREMIVTRELVAGSRVSERDLATKFGVSRTPVRAALRVLQTEGLVSGEPNCGFVVTPFSIEEVLSAYDVRSVLEGLAVRTAVERGISRKAMRRLEQAVAEGAALVASGELQEEEMRRWAKANAIFHGTLIDCAGLPALVKVDAVISRMPLAAPIAIMFTDYDRDFAHTAMVEAHSDHVHLLAAIMHGESARAEALMREHVLRSRDNLGENLRHQLNRHEDSITTSLRFGQKAPVGVV